MCMWVYIYIYIYNIHLLIFDTHGASSHGETSRRCIIYIYIVLLVETTIHKTKIDHGAMYRCIGLFRYVTHGVRKSERRLVWPRLTRSLSIDISQGRLYLYLYLYIYIYMYKYIYVDVGGFIFGSRISSLRSFDQVDCTLPTHASNPEGENIHARATLSHFHVEWFTKYTIQTCYHSFIIDHVHHGGR